MESDETRIRNAAHLMVASLAGSLAHVTCKVLYGYLVINMITSVVKILKFYRFQNSLHCYWAFFN